MVHGKIQEGSRLADVIMVTLTVLICIITIYPMYYVLIMSVSDPISVMSKNVFFLPKGFQLETYALLFQNKDMWSAYLNTIIYVAAATVLVIITCGIGAYPLTVKTLWGRKWIVRFLLVPMYFSGGLIPTFLLMTKLGLYNNRLAIIVPSAVSIWYIILTRTYFTSIPEEMRESAFMDGAANWQILLKIYLPLAKPILAVIAIYSIVGMWNSWFSAMLYLPNAKLHPLQMYLQRVLIQQSVDLTKLNSTEIEDAIRRKMSGAQLKYSIIIFTTLPIIFTYPFFQRYFIKGVMIGSLKG